MKIRRIGISILALQFLYAQTQEMQKPKALTYFDIIPSHVTESWSHDWQRQSYAPNAEIHPNEAIRICNCVKTDSPCLAPIIYFFYKKNPAPALPVLNELLTLAVEFAKPFEFPQALYCLLKVTGIDPNVVDSNYRYGCDLNAADNNGWTALQGNQDILYLLLNCPHLDLFKKTKDGRTSYDAVDEDLFPDIKKILKQAMEQKIAHNNHLRSLRHS